MKKTIFTFLVIAMSIAVFAANQVVTSNGNSGAGTLRQAMIDVHSGGTITFNLNAGDESITVLSQLEWIQKSIIIDGANTAGSGNQVTVTVTTPGVSDSRIFYFDTSGNTFTLKNIELVGGKPNGGGAISMHQGHLSMDNVIVRDSKSGSSTTKGGGGILIEGTTSTTITNSKFLNNEAIGTSGSSGDLGNGGAIAIYSGATTITNCTFDGNTGVVHGGAIYSSVNLDISGSTFNANTCDGYGGAINFHDGTSTVTNCTFSDNNAAGHNGWGGGAIMIGDDIAPGSLKVTLRFTTVAGNTAGSNQGGGIYLWRGEADIKNCFLGDNTVNDFYLYGSSTLTDGGYNIVEVQHGSQFGPTNNILGQQANLFGTGKTTQTLASNGGSTQTLEIEHGSVALGAGVADVTDDQRGVTRADPPTIGAFEYLNAQVTIETAQSGNFLDLTTWDYTRIPTSNDNIVIKPGHTLTIPSGTISVAKHMEVEATGIVVINGELFVEDMDVNGDVTVTGKSFVNGGWGTVTGANGTIWMDRNLGAGRVATSLNDEAAYGDYYQWGRAAEDHQFKLAATHYGQATTAVPLAGNAWDHKYITVPTTNQPHDWLTPSDDNLWVGVNGTNNPCPAGYRIPTKDEWQAELDAGDASTSEKFFNSSNLKLPAASFKSNGFLSPNPHAWMWYWSSTPNNAIPSSVDYGKVWLLLTYGTNLAVQEQAKQNGGSVRCIKD